jgi:hypothetical protein
LLLSKKEKEKNGSKDREMDIFSGMPLATRNEDHEFHKLFPAIPSTDRLIDGTC